jgi:4-amino-4-deoxy-L-arabinose transferase-like glycosyltransferase
MASIKKRGTTYYAQYYRCSQHVRRCLRTESLQVAREKLRQLESQLYRGEEPLGPTRTPLPDALEDYIAYARVSEPQTGRAPVAQGGPKGAAQAAQETSALA